MKFCPKCGAQLVDEARFCSKCGAPQPNMENAPAPQPAPVVEPQPEVAPVQEPTQMTPAQRYNHLKQNDERFKATVKVIFLLKFVGLIGLLFIIPLLVNYLTPVGTITGIEMSSQGSLFMSSMGKSVPYNFSMYEVQFLLRPAVNAGHYKLTPDNALNNVMPTVLWYFGFLFFVVIALVSMLGMTKGYVLRTYEKDPNELYKALKGNTTWIFGPALSIITMILAIFTYINCKDLDYSGGETYYFGVIIENKSGLIVCIVVSLIFATIMIAGSIVLRSLLFKKIDKHYQK